MRAYYTFKLYRSILNHSPTCNMTQTLAESSHSDIFSPGGLICTLKGIFKGSGSVHSLCPYSSFSFSHHSLCPLCCFDKLASLSLTLHDLHLLSESPNSSCERFFRSNWVCSHHVGVALWISLLCLFEWGRKDPKLMKIISLPFI